MIGIGQILLGELLSLAKSIQWLTNQRQQILVFDSDVIEAPIIHAKAEAFIWLPIEEDRCSGGGLGRPNKTVGQVGLDISLLGF